MSDKIVNGSGKGTTPQACASCKYQRRKCHKDCFLAPYFPANQQEDFKNAHKLFGVSNILKILKLVEPDRRAEASRSITLEAQLRKEDPVNGSVGAIRKLIKKIETCTKELSLVNQQLLFFRQQQEQQLQRLLASTAASSSSSPLQLVPFGIYNYQPSFPFSLPNNEVFNLEELMNLDPGGPFSILQGYEALMDLDIKPTNPTTNSETFADVDRKPVPLATNISHLNQNVGQAVTRDSEESSDESTLTGKPSIPEVKPKCNDTRAESTFPDKSSDKYTSDEGKEMDAGVPAQHNVVKGNSGGVKEVEPRFFSSLKREGMEGENTGDNKKLRMSKEQVDVSVFVDYIVKDEKFTKGNGGKLDKIKAVDTEENNSSADGKVVPKVGAVDNIVPVNPESLILDRMGKEKVSDESQKRQVCDMAIKFQNEQEKITESSKGKKMESYSASLVLPDTRRSGKAVTDARAWTGLQNQLQGDALWEGSSDRSSSLVGMGAYDAGNKSDVVEDLVVPSKRTTGQI